jgi:hypothetical protein
MPYRFLKKDQLSDKEWTLYFEEVQWLAEYKDDFIADLKYVWDNKFRHNPKLLIVLCGSSTVCEIKYLQTKVGNDVIDEFEEKLRQCSLLQMG